MIERILRMPCWEECVVRLLFCKPALM